MYTILRTVIQEVETFQLTNKGQNLDINSFIIWLKNRYLDQNSFEPNWENKQDGRSAESMICTLLVHLSRYTKMYSKSIVMSSSFSTQDEFIYLINLKVFGEMSKMELIKKNIHEKPVGIQIINRLISHGWIEQKISNSDKRRKILTLTDEGKKVLEEEMPKIKMASKIVTGNLTYSEKMDLITLLLKLEMFHNTIYQKNIPSDELLDTIYHTL